jgi:hypothetical protein
MSEAIINTKKEYAKLFLESINKELRSKFEELRSLKLNANTKGGEYEKHVANLLHDYLGSRFEFHVRAHLIDAEMEYLNIFSTGENEIDIIGTFSNALPRIILKVGDTRYVSYDAVAFTVDIKSRLDRQKLGQDLDKLSKISKLRKSPPAVGSVMYARSHFLDRPLRCLFYFEKSIDRIEMEKILDKYYSAWDIILLIDNNEILLNGSLPIVKQIMSQNSLDGTILSWGGDNCFIMLLNIISATIPVYLEVDVTKTFLNLDYFSKQ